MPAIRPAVGALVGRIIRLEPLTRHALPELYRAIGYPEVFAGGYGGGPEGLPSSLDAFLDFAERYYSWETANVYVARIMGGNDDGTLVGTSTLGDFNETREHAHIGWTAWDPRVWGTAVNPEAKLMMLGLAFDSGFGRVKLQTDSLNARSRAAIEKLGGQYEGIVRRDSLRADGSWRDTAVYSVIVDEWPLVRAGLIARLDAAGWQPVSLDR